MQSGSGAGRRDPRYDILFEPLQIGPVTAKVAEWSFNTLEQGTIQAPDIGDALPFRREVAGLKD